MAKKTRRAAPKKAPNATSKRSRFLAGHPDLLPLAILSVFLLLFFGDVILGGKTYMPPDTITAQSVEPFVKGALSRGVYPLWNPYIFGGMPSFASLQSAPYIDLIGDLVLGVRWVLGKALQVSGFVIIYFNYLLFGIFTYLLLLRKTGVRLAGFFAAACLVFQPQIISYTVFGHNTKIATAALIPVIFLLLDDLLQKRQLQYFALLALAVGLQLLRAHTQISYYTFMMVALYLLFWIIEAIKAKKPAGDILKPLSASIIALIVGVLMSSWLYLSVLEYAEYSIRGGGTGLDYSYATNWSFAPIEMITFLIPSFMGFGGQTYWGEMPFTDYPFYMGVLTLMLAGLALIMSRNRYVIFFAILAGLSLLVSFGKHFPVLYTPLFEILPFFNKFRVPSMILVLFAFAMVSLAGFGLKALISVGRSNEREKVRKYTLIFSGVCAFFALVVIVGQGFYVGLIAGSEKPLGTQAAEAAYDMAAKDALKLLAIIGIAAFLILAFLKDKLKAQTLGLILVALTVADLWLVDNRLADPRPKAQKENYFVENAAVKFLKQQEEPFRIYPIFDQKPETWYQYFLIQNIRGYHAAKLKIYQTFLEKTGLDSRNVYGMPPMLSKYLAIGHEDGRPTVRTVSPDELPAARLRSDYAVLDMLNVKYLISEYPIPDPRFRMVVNERPFVFENTGVQPRAYFVDEIKTIDSPDAFFDYLRSGEFDPGKTAVLEESPEFAIQPDANNSVTVTSYDIHEIILEATVAKPALMVLSEVYYPAGWKAYVDDVETKIYKTNTILRSIFLQPGSHRIRFHFAPRSFYLGLWLTFGILAILLGLLVYSWRSRRQPANDNSKAVA